jgi:hypothetical protein
MRSRYWIAVRGDEITGSAIFGGQHPRYPIEVTSDEEIALLRHGLRRCLYVGGRVVLKPTVTLRCDVRDFAADGDVVAAVRVEGAPDGRAVTLRVTMGGVRHDVKLAPGERLELTAAEAGPVVVELVDHDLHAAPLTLQAVEP